MADSRNKIMLIQIPFNGTWMPSAEPAVIGQENFIELQNLRYKDDGTLRAVNGYSNINFPLVEPDYVYSKGYVFFGDNGVNYLVATSEYDPIFKTWAVKADNQYGNYEINFACVAVDEIIYTFGGMTTRKTPWRAECFAYNASADTWSTKTSLLDHRGCMAASLISSKIYIYGGEADYGPLLTCDEYDPSGDSWTNKADMPLPKREFCGAGTVNDKGYVISGVDDLSAVLADCDEYSPVADTWTSKLNATIAREKATVAAFNEALYLIGGCTIDYNPSTNINNCDEYTPLTDTWAVKTDCPPPLINSAGSWVQSGDCICISGGADTSGNPVAGVNAYAPVTDVWSVETDMTTAILGHAGASVLQ